MAPAPVYLPTVTLLLVNQIKSWSFLIPLPTRLFRLFAQTISKGLLSSASYNRVGLKFR